MYVDALGPDRCRSDRCAPCTYYHLKVQALNGGRARLSPEQLEFVGATVHWHDTAGGWRQPVDAVGQFEDQLSAEETAMLPALMDVGVPGRDRLDFLG